MFGAESTLSAEPNSLAISTPYGASTKCEQKISHQNQLGLDIRNRLDAQIVFLNQSMLRDADQRQLNYKSKERNKMKFKFLELATIDR